MVWNVFQCLPMEDLPYVWQGISIPNLLMGQEQKKEQSLAEGGFAMLASKMMLLDQELQEMPAKRTSRFWALTSGCQELGLGYWVCPFLIAMSGKLQMGLKHITAICNQYWQ